ncbi:hypothetical protein LIER_29234 [Lithospermum erythrorhizon]|uniref:Reverse transcriptase domain-containing protein n=1 Tax=Lithospermum erythrorhizon TaxID=34254 RepID=A0AAV3RLR7_LITER
MEGVWQEGQDQVEAEVMRYFMDIFSANEGCCPNKTKRLVDSSVTEEMNQQLTREITCEEVKPISLCNIVGKIIGRVMKNRLRYVLMHIISKNQSVFLPRRIISDNILIDHEVLLHMNHKTSRKRSSMELKLDMSKAYDRVEWKFLEAIMLKFGFCRTRVDWTMCFVSTVSYSFLLNGTPRDFIRPTRGIWQGDLLSPYIFLLCAGACLDVKGG